MAGPFNTCQPRSLGGLLLAMFAHVVLSAQLTRAMVKPKAERPHMSRATEIIISQLHRVTSPRAPDMEANEEGSPSSKRPPFYVPIIVICVVLAVGSVGGVALFCFANGQQQAKRGKVNKMDQLIQGTADAKVNDPQIINKESPAQKVENQSNANQDSLRGRFDLAAQKFEDSARARKINPSYDTYALLYGLYKQALFGNVRGSRPWSVDVKGRIKYDAWASNQGMSSDDAMEKYIAEVDRILEEAGVNK